MFVGMSRFVYVNNRGFRTVSDPRLKIFVDVVSIYRFSSQGTWSKSGSILLKRYIIVPSGEILSSISRPPLSISMRYHSP